MTKNVRWGILGAGRIADKFCTAINFTEGSEVYAVASRDSARAGEYATKFHAAKAYNNYEDLINDDQVDIIYIATPHVFHYEQTMLCLRNKKAVICEKPMSLSYRHTAEMVATAVKEEVFFMEGMWTACMPFMDKIKELIAAGAIGEPQFVTADFGFTAIKDMQSRLYNKSLGGGSILDIGIYPVSLATLILGAPAVIKSVSKLAETGVDEYANIILQYSTGATAQLLSTIGFNTPVEAAIIGEKGSIKIKNPWFKATDIELQNNDGAVQIFSMPHGCNGFEYEIAEVTQCLGKGLLQSEKVPHHFTLTLSKIMDELLEQAGVVYNI